MADVITMDQMHKFDDVFLGILQNCGKIEPFLEAIFDFLARRTDFFRLMHKKDDKLGFPPGVARKTVLKIFDKYQQIVLQNDPLHHKEDKKEAARPPPKQSIQTSSTSIPTEIPNVAHEVEVNTEQKTERKTSSLESSETDFTEAASQSNPSNSNDCFNGGKTDRYTWSQSISDVDILIPVPSFVKKSKDLSIDIKPEHLKVRLKKNLPADCKLKDNLLIEGDLTNRIICEDSLWSLTPGEQISINLEKAQQKWWTAVIVGDAEIAREDIDTTQHVHEFDTQTQADIRKVMYDQQQKMMGKPTSDEQKTHDLLKEAWDAEGSPFKGTPFDPSSINLAGNNTF
ncbi:nudC domain-containing protein 3-like [Hydractinia symbiolongicarpus]|uniref:nudC domain-containing protein 3-like n=1 Tax=Hydractinia symbiolongicarpus TaxID=13093 RepID=UPI00254BB174|nr:nudC domain-containing protein 3-like [Hydractinia symbiolongicarpus]